jgi:hypothetical protein
MITMGEKNLVRLFYYLDYSLASLMLSNLVFDGLEWKFSVTQFKFQNSDLFPSNELFSINVEPLTTPCQSSVNATYTDNK